MKFHHECRAFPLWKAQWISAVKTPEPHLKLFQLRRLEATWGSRGGAAELRRNLLALKMAEIALILIAH